MFPALDIAKELKSQAFHRLDTQRRGQGKVWVDANRLIDLCLAFEAAAEGRVDNLEHIIKTQGEIIDEARKRLNQIAELTSPHSEAFRIACQHL